MIAPGYTYGTVTDKISSIVLTGRTSLWWLAGLGFSFLLTMLLMLLYSITYLLLKGIGIWGVNIPVGWGFAITNFVWWIGIGHAGTLISAILLLLRQDWRTSINRFAEAMTLFAVACAGLFPLLHLGRPWYFYWLTPYPNTMALWPQWRSPLVWDVFCRHLFHRLAALLVHRVDPRSSHLARPGKVPLCACHLWHSGDGVAQCRFTLAALSHGLLFHGRVGDPAGCLRAYGGQL